MPSWAHAGPSALRRIRYARLHIDSTSVILSRLEAIATSHQRDGLLAVALPNTPLDSSLIMACFHNGAPGRNFSGLIFFNRVSFPSMSGSAFGWLGGAMAEKESGG